MRKVTISEMIIQGCLGRSKATRSRISSHTAFESSRSCADDTDQVVISRATMMSSFRINEVNEMATMLMNSDSNKKRERSMMTLPV